MASNDYDEHGTCTDDSKDDDSNRDSGFLRVDQIPRIRPIKVTRLNTVEELKNELEICKTANIQLGAQIYTLNKKVVTSETNFRKERMRFESTKNFELMKKDTKIKQAMVEIEKMRQYNTALLRNIKILETNENKLQTKLAAFKDKKSNELIESESKKTEDNEKELQDLKQRLKFLETKLEEKNEIIAMPEDSKINETLEHNTQAVKDMQGMLSEIADSLEKSKKKEAKMALKVEDMEQNLEQKMNQILSAVHSKNVPNDPGRDEKTSNYHKGTIKEEEMHSGLLATAKYEGATGRSINSGKQETEMTRSIEGVPKLPPLPSIRSKSPDKPPWHYTGGPTRKSSVPFDFSLNK